MKHNLWVTSPVASLFLFCFSSATQTLADYSSSSSNTNRKAYARTTCRHTHTHAGAHIWIQLWLLLNNWRDAIKWVRQHHDEEWRRGRRAGSGIACRWALNTGLIMSGCKGEERHISPRTWRLDSWSAPPGRRQSSASKICRSPDGFRAFTLQASSGPSLDMWYTYTMGVNAEPEKWPWCRDHVWIILILWN